MKIKTAARWAARLLFLALAVAAAAGLLADIQAASMIPSLSPLAALAGFIAGRAWLRGWLTITAPLALLALAVWKSRLFCRWACPLGTIYALPSAFSLKKKLLHHPINAYVFWAIIGMAIIGAPLLLFLDPLSTFNRLSPFAREMRLWVMLAPAAIVPLFFLLSFIQPLIWCGCVCPLGYMFDLAHKRMFWRTMKSDAGRRKAILGIALGLPLGLAARMFGVKQKKGGRLPVLPPGAGTQEHFSNTCTRCYACVNECALATGVLTVKAPVDVNFSAFFQPELDTRRSYCSESCNRCSQVCPSGAIRRLSTAEKHSRQIGLAKIEKTLCLAWEFGESCMVCDEYCPYGAIDFDYDENDLPRPVVNADVCRGCGSCEFACPAYDTAIVVHGLPAQKQAPSTPRGNPAD